MLIKIGAWYVRPEQVESVEAPDNDKGYPRGTVYLTDSRELWFHAETVAELVGMADAFAAELNQFEHHARTYTPWQRGFMHATQNVGVTP